MPATAVDGQAFLDYDRDALFTVAFGATLAAAFVQVVACLRFPDVERVHGELVRTIKESCLDRLILLGERSLRRVVTEFMAHYHLERNHQGWIIG